MASRMSPSLGSSLTPKRYRLPYPFPGVHLPATAAYLVVEGRVNHA